ncbi:MAG: cytosolic protein, partial [Blastocatellia bacterium]
MLDKELQKITADAAIGRRAVDKLVKVWLKTGKQAWVLIHIEVQGRREAKFDWRVFIYQSRIINRFNLPMATFVVLTDEHSNWRPSEFHYELLGTENRLRFSAAKLLDFRRKWAELEKSDNPFAIVVMAHLRAMETRRDPRRRLNWKVTLTRMLYRRGYSKRDVVDLMRFLDWVMALP